ncbi:MAG TPA: SWIM zinc finger domain-containing protein [Candidatus Ozemobacteraceae bacterium]|nr:SWIM zinc finger domain-containing protein [Candidatus Ozemobacteraceae bacterium]
MADQTHEIDLYSREVRVIRAARDVLAKYAYGQPVAGPDGRLTFRVTGGTKPYEVTIDPAWLLQPACTCPDAENRAKTHTGGFCKHIIALMIKDARFQAQLLDLFL